MDKVNTQNPSFEDLMYLAGNVADARFAMLCGQENPQFTQRIRQEFADLMELYIKQRVDMQVAMRDRIVNAKPQFTKDQIITVVVGGGGGKDDNK